MLSLQKEAIRVWEQASGRPSSTLSFGISPAQWPGGSPFTSLSMHLCGTFTSENGNSNSVLFPWIFWLRLALLKWRHWKEASPSSIFALWTQGAWRIS